MPERSKPKPPQTKQPGATGAAAVDPGQTSKADDGRDAANARFAAEVAVIHTWAEKRRRLLKQVLPEIRRLAAGVKEAIRFIKIDGHKRSNGDRRIVSLPEFAFRVGSLLHCLREIQERERAEGVVELIPVRVQARLEVFCAWGCFAAVKKDPTVVVSREMIGMLKQASAGLRDYLAKLTPRTDAVARGVSSSRTRRRGRPAQKEPDQRMAEAHRMRQEGASFSAIGQHFGKSHTTARIWCLTAARFYRLPLPTSRRVSFDERRHQPKLKPR